MRYNPSMHRLRRFFSLRLAREFLALESAGGMVMLGTTSLAMLLANSPASASYFAFTHAPLALGLTLHHFVVDVLMALFFFTVGMELKYEMREGALAAPGQKILPLLAALGGVAAPALIYLYFTHATPGLGAGWAIPTATDIAFALCVLRLLGSAVPQGAKIFLLALAIYDDLAAILIIALFYAHAPGMLPLGLVALVCAALWGLNRLHVRALWPYLALGAALWLAVYHAGIHPTVAGVITALAIPLRSRAGVPVLAPLLHRLHPWVAFGVLPLFAFTVAGVDLRGLALSDALGALPLGIALALFLGKPLGIFLATLAGVRLRIAPLPAGVRWGVLYGVATVAGIGFTMSLFIGDLAFSDPEHENLVKLGVLAGSLFSALFGVILLRLRRTS